MKRRDWIDAEFVVIEDRREPEPVRWSFWEDDFPNLAGIAGGFAALFGLKLLFAHWL